MRTWKNNEAFPVALLIGICAQLIPQLISGRQPDTEAILWLYSSFPLMIIAAGILGFVAPDHPSLWAISILLGDFLTGLLMAQNGLNLLPVGLLLYAIYAILYILAGHFGAFLYRHNKRAITGRGGSMGPGSN